MSKSKLTYQPMLTIHVQAYQPHIPMYYSVLTIPHIHNHNKIMCNVNLNTKEV